MTQSSPKISRSALALLFNLLSTPKMVLCAEQCNSRQEYQDLLAARLLTPICSNPSSVCIDGVERDIVSNATGPRLGYFSAGAGWVNVPVELLQRYRIDPFRVLSAVRHWLEISDRSPISTLQHDAIWDLGETWVGKRKLAILFMRRAHLPQSMQQLRQSLQVFPRRKSAMVLTDTPANRFGPHLPGELLCIEFMDLVPQGEVTVSAIDKEIIGELIGLGIPKRKQSGPVSCSQDGGELVVNGVIYRFKGLIHRSIVRQLYEAWDRGEPRVRKEMLLETAESKSNTISQAFSGCKTQWRKVIDYGEGCSWLIYP